MDADKKSGTVRHKALPYLAAALEAERRRLSADLHDRTGPQLAAIALNLRTLESELAKNPRGEFSALLGETRKLLSETVSEIRNFSAELRPAILDDAGLVRALEERVMQFRHRTGLQVQFCADGIAEPLPYNIELLLYRAVQEALTNCAKHASARCVAIELAQSAGAITLRIEDDGVGFDSQHICPKDGDLGTGAGLGLVTMREGVERARGRFVLFSKLGGGTKIHIELPLAFASPNSAADDGRKRRNRRMNKRKRANVSGTAGVHG